MLATALEVGAQGVGGLVAILRIFGQQLQHQVRQQLGHVGVELARRLRLDRDQAVGELSGVGGVERRAPRQHQVVGRAQ
jgi:hypothetical protein